ncbi:hypothetical protein OSR52_10190 [Galbibacter sp. CMA-7]|uniref:Uncharacterized protein n=1 Tax=Galbibacter pacificus TaxID=2996052 RepID=A0ABT6FT56_9FLAO|nr:hypothetical protein [Galbibacter pacificus]
MSVQIQAQVTLVTGDSYKLNEKREISFYVPEDYSKEKTYPLLLC